MRVNEDRTSNCSVGKMGPDTVEGPPTTYPVYLRVNKSLGALSNSSNRRLSIQIKSFASMDVKKEAFITGFQIARITTIPFLTRLTYLCSSQRMHLRPPLNIKPTCPKFPAALRTPDSVSFLRLRNLSELGVINLYFRFVIRILSYLKEDSRTDGTLDCIICVAKVNAGLCGSEIEHHDRRPPPRE